MNQEATIEAQRLTGFLAACGYEPPDSADDVALDIVTPTRNRRVELVEQAKLIGPQLGANDRWIIVDDASDVSVDPRELIPYVAKEKLVIVYLTYARGEEGTINRARHLACSIARPDAWIVEVDDHDFVVNPKALELVRDAVVRGATLVYGDVLVEADGGRVSDAFAKPDYEPWLLRDQMCPTEGVRAYPKFLYEAAGGYRWYGKIGVGGNEFPAGDYGLFLRIEALCDGKGFYRIPVVLNRQPKVVGGISTRFCSQQADMAIKLRQAARSGELLNK